MDLKMNALLMFSLLATGAHLENLRMDAKIPINLDVSKAIPEQVNVDPVGEEPNALLHSIKPEYEADYKIGDVICNGELILENDERNSERFVTFTVESSGKYYIEVVNVYFTRRGVKRYLVEEFVKRPWDHAYDAVTRTPVGVDIAMQQSTRIIKVRFTQNTKEITIKNTFRFELVIGVVRYGHYIIDDRVDGMLKKYVILSEHTNPSSINIISTISNGFWSDRYYEYVGGDRPFVLVHETLEPVF